MKLFVALFLINLNLFASDTFYFDNGVKKPLYKVHHKKAIYNTQLKKIISLQESKNLKRSNDTISLDVFTTKQNGGSLITATDSIIAEFKPNIEVKQIKSLISDYQLLVIKKMRGLKNKWLLKGNISQNILDISNQLTTLDEIVSARPDFFIDINKRRTLPKKQVTKEESSLIDRFLNFFNFK